MPGLDITLEMDVSSVGSRYLRMEQVKIVEDSF